MKNVLSLLTVFSLFIWAIAYFMYHEKGFIHIFLVIAALASSIRVIQEVYYEKRRFAKSTLVRAVK